jgi:hypothetical protein
MTTAYIVLNNAAELVIQFLFIDTVTFYVPSSPSFEWRHYEYDALAIYHWKVEMHVTNAI